MDGMDLSLDDLIKTSQKGKKTGGRGKPQVQAGKGKKGAFNGKVGGSKGRKGGRRSEPYQGKIKVSVNMADEDDDDEQPSVLRQPTKGSVSVPLTIFERIGNKPLVAEVRAPAVSGTFVTISNLNLDITLADLSELCATIGEIKSVEFLPLVSAKKQAKVLFARRSDALKCVEKFHDLTFDGTPMKLKLTGHDGKENPFNPFDTTGSEREPKNVKASFFGTALGGGDTGDDSGPTFSVRMGDKPSFGTRRDSDDNVCYAFQSGSCKYGDSCRFSHEIGGRGGRGGSGGGGRGAGRGDRKSLPKKDGRGGGRKETVVSAEDLDNDLDNYLNKTETQSKPAKGGKGGKGKGKGAQPSSDDLDADLDGYFNK